MKRSIFAKGLLAAAATATVFGAAAVPQIASAQSYDDNGYYDRSYDAQSYYDACRKERGDRQVAGAVIGGLAGAAIGGGISGRGGGALVGGALGAAGGVAVGGATADCQPAPVYDPGPPPPPVYDDRYTDHYPPSCTWVEDRITFPDGTFQRSSVRACRDPGGRWYVAQ